MNLIELENLVKGAPDDYLVKEVQQPTGKVPPFLALSEIQRRKDMRDRYMAQKNQGAKPTIAEQLTGGIGSLGGAEAMQGAPIPTPAATGIPSVAAPPIAAGAAPMPTPQGMPQGFAAGGQIGYADGSVIPLGSEVRSRTPYLDDMTAAQMQYQVAPGGLGEFPPVVEPTPVAPVVPAPPPPPPKYENKYGMTPAQVKLAEMLMDPNSAKVPEAINYDELIAQAGQSEKDIREEARRDAISAALIKLGAGLAAGNMGAGFSAAGDAVSDIMRQGRTEASAERRMAQQLSLQAKEGKRQQAIQQLEYDRNRLEAIANLESDSKEKAEQRAYRTEEARRNAAYQSSQLQFARQRGELDRQQFEYGKFATANKLITDNAIALTGPRPDKTEMSDYQIALKSWNRFTKTDSKGNKIDDNGKVIPKPVNPEEAWTRTFIGNVTQQAQVIAPEFELDASIFSPTASVAPVSNPPKNLTEPPQAAIEALKKNPKMKSDFDAKYGKGMADRYLK